MFRQRSTIFFIGALLLIYLVTGIFHTLPLPPQGVHYWAQTDRASVAATYYQDGMDFFHPRVYNLNNGTGYTGLEFPLVNYLAACFYKLFGFHEFWYRLLMLCIVTIGAIASHRLASLHLQNKTYVWFVSLGWLLSPVILYYSANFLSDAASLGFIMVAWLFFFKLRDKVSIGWLALFIISGSLAALVKATSAISLICMTTLLLIDFTGKLDPEGKPLFSKKPLLLAALSLMFFVTYQWYAYAAYLKMHHYSQMFHLGINPPGDAAEAWALIKEFPSMFLYHYYAPAMLAFFVCCLGFLIFFLRRQNRLLLFILA